MRSILQDGACVPNELSAIQEELLQMKKAFFFSPMIADPTLSGCNNPGCLGSVRRGLWKILQNQGVVPRRNGILLSIADLISIKIFLIFFLPPGSVSPCKP